MMKLIHLADLHGSPSRADEFLKSIRVAEERGRAENVDLYVIAGDIWDHVIQNTAGSRFISMVDAVRRLADVAPIAMIYGTPTHDAEGSLEVFETLESRFGITILQPGKAYFLSGLGLVSDQPSSDPISSDKTLLFGVPEPSKKWLMKQENENTTAEAAVRDALRGLFFGLGATRKSIAGLPCVLLYHGQVGGARLQNGELLDLGSGLRPSVDDLAMVGADYIAMGDIHEPQRVSGGALDLPAYYPGSAYPVDFGETHEAGCNLVEVEIGRHTVTRVPFGHPVNQTIRAHVVEDMFGLDLNDHEPVIRGRRVKLEISCTKEQYQRLDLEHFEARLRLQKAAEGSIVVPKVQPTETVRAAEITDKTTAEEKLGVWFDQSKKEFTGSLREKFHEVESEAKAEGLVSTGARIRINRLVLRGAIGLKAKSDLDEIDFNLDEVDEGLLALIGKNGAGKTTLLENLQPWPQLVTRDGTLKSQFFGRDAMRDLYWTDVESGIRYEAKITINAAVDSGATEYYLYQDVGNGFEPYPGITGRKDEYVAAIDALFGSMDLFLRSAFVTQRQPKGLSDLADATPRERKTLFTELCGLAYWEAYKAIAKTRGDEQQRAADLKQNEIEVLSARLPDVEQLRAEADSAREEIEDAHGDLCILEELGKDKRKKVDEIGLRAKENSDREGQAEEAARVALDAEIRTRAINDTVTGLRGTIERKAAAEATVADFGRLTGELAQENAKVEEHRKLVDAERQEVDTLREQHDTENRKILAAHQVLVDQRHETLNALTREMETIHTEYRAARDVEVRLENRVDHLKRQLDEPVTETCPTCGQSLPDEALETVRQSRQALQDELDQVTQDLAAAHAKAKDADDRYTAKKQERDTLPAVPPPETKAFVPPESAVRAFDSRRLKDIQARLAFIEIEQARQTLTDAAAAGARIEELTKQLVDLAATADRERRRESELRAGLDPEIAAKHAAALASLEQTRNLYAEAQRRDAQASAKLDQCELRLKASEKERQEIEGLKAELDRILTTVAEWRLLELALSDKGVQALEIDAVAPSIATIANRLLDAFGSRSRIEFQTTRESGKGSKAKQIEDLLIMVLDQEKGTTQELATLSGGEAVWIRRALYDAFGIIRARNAKLDFLTVFQDEADGALDPAAKLTYLRMLEEAHKLSGRAHTIIITHSESLQELIPTKIEVAKLKPRKEAVAA